MKFENTNVYNFQNAIRGMRNALNSWDKSDSQFKWFKFDELPEGSVVLDRTPDDTWLYAAFIGSRDLKLAQSLIKHGSEHRKFLRQIFVSVDITAPIYWFKELSTYKVATVANSTSTMHTIISNSITIDCFECDDLNIFEQEILNNIIKCCEYYRLKYKETNDKSYWKALIRILPESWLQTRTWTANYEILLSIFHQRRNHKLNEWYTFIKWIKKLPYAEELLLIDL